MSYIAQFITLFLALFGAFYKNTQKTDAEKNPIYWHGLPVLTPIGWILVIALTLSSGASIYSAYANSVKEEDQKKELADKEREQRDRANNLQETLNKVSTQNASILETQIERFEKILVNQEKVGERTIDKIEGSSTLLANNIENSSHLLTGNITESSHLLRKNISDSSEILRGDLSTSTNFLQTNIKSSSKLLRQNIVNQAFTINDFNVTVYFDTNYDFGQKIVTGKEVLSRMFCSGPRNQSWVFVIPIGIPVGYNSQLEIKIQSRDFLKNEVDGVCEPTIKLRSEVSGEEIDFPTLIIMGRHNKLFFEGHLTLQFIEALKLKQPINMNTFLMARSEAYFDVLSFNLNDKNEIETYLKRILPTRMYYYIQPEIDLKNEDLTNVAWSFVRDSKYFSLSNSLSIRFDFNRTNISDTFDQKNWVNNK
ncbi:MAG TPA: hypothetical protein VF571_03875 [Pyrinomonadaceae bacterium]|jgi:hypothetical protein